MKKLLLILFVALWAHAQVFARPQAEKVSLAGACLENIYRIDEGVYRCEQPYGNDFVALEAFGIQEVLSLRRYHGDRSQAKGSGLKLYWLKTRASKIGGQDLADALSVILNREGPIVFHCWHGSDRTGAVCAAYRVVVQGWPKDDAIDEMVNGGFGFHKQFSQIIDVIEGLDVDSMRRQLGLEKQ